MSKSSIYTTIEHLVDNANVMRLQPNNLAKRGTDFNKSQGKVNEKDAAQKRIDSC